MLLAQERPVKKHIAVLLQGSQRSQKGACVDATIDGQMREGFLVWYSPRIQFQGCAGDSGL